MQNTSSSVEPISLHDTVFLCVFFTSSFWTKTCGISSWLSLEMLWWSTSTHILLFGNKQICIEQWNFIKNITVSHLSPCILQLKNHIELYCRFSFSGNKSTRLSHKVFDAAFGFQEAPAAASNSCSTRRLAHAHTKLQIYIQLLNES